MTADTHRATTTAGSAGVIAWRRRRLVDAGFDAITAALFAQAGSVDLHELIELVERGCPPELAARIMAPIDLVELTR